MNLYNKYRPSSFEELKGNKETISSLQHLINKKYHPHSYLFTGNKGCGKTTIAKIVAEEFGCIGEDVQMINSADFRGIDTIRNIKQNINLIGLSGGNRAFIIDECHKMTNDAQNAFLKELEEPPDHVYFFLCTTDPQKLIGTLKDRCQHYVLQPLNEIQTKNLLKTIVKKEKETIDQEVYEQIVEDSQGHPRAAIQILEKVLTVPKSKRLKIAKKTAEEEIEIIKLCRELMSHKNPPWKKISNILKGLQDKDPEEIRRSVLGYCKTILLKESNNRAAAIIEEFIDNFYDSGFTGVVYACYNIINGE